MTSLTVVRNGNNTNTNIPGSYTGTQRAIYPTLPPLARTCRQAYTELAANLYHENIFVFRLHASDGTIVTSTKAFEKWLNCPTRAPAHRAAIVANLAHVKLVFLLRYCTDLDLLDADLGGCRDASIEVKNEPDGGCVSVNADRKLSRCRCNVVQAAKTYVFQNTVSEAAQQNRVIEYISGVEEFVYRTGFEDLMPDVRKCETCREGSGW